MNASPPLFGTHTPQHDIGRTRDFLDRVLPWPARGEPGVCNLHWFSKRSPGVRGRPYISVDDMLGMLAWGKTHPAVMTDIYICLSRQSRTGKNARGKATAARHADNALALKAVWLDVDVKDPPKGYATLDEAITALQQFLTKTALPKPTAIVGSGGGMHVYWISDKPLTPDEWRPYAEGLRALAVQYGLRCDAGLTTDAARILRVPDTSNYKTDPPRPVRLLDMRPVDYDFADDLAMLPKVVPNTAAGKPKAAPTDDSAPWDAANFAGKQPPTWAANLPLEKSEPNEIPPLDFMPIMQGCPLFRDAVRTHGKDHSQPLWNLSILATTFMHKGDQIAHWIGNHHPGYTKQSTDAMYQRKLREKEQRGLGWPSCKAFEGAGSAFCKKCPHYGKIKSPLKLTSRQAPAVQLPAGRVIFRDYNNSGTPKPSLANAVIAIRALGIEVRYDQFHNRVKVAYKGGSKIIQDGVLTDDTVSATRSLINNTFRIDCGDPNTFAALKEIARDNAYDPVLDLLAECQGKWDRQKRIDTWVVNYLGCEDTSLNRAIGRLVLVAACRRARLPGCKSDLIVVLEGVEGTNKSTAIRVLAGDENFSDQSILGAKDKEVQEQLDGVWMHENADLAGMKRAEVEQIKAFASRQVDRGRPAYGRVREDRPRRSIEWGTTNNDQYLLSQTGNRRFAPLKTGRIDIEALKRNREQLLGEAATYEANGESITLDPSLWGDARAAQEQRRVVDPWEELLQHMPDHIIHCSGDGFERVASADVLEHVLHIPINQRTSAHGQRLANAMKHAGWDRNPTGRVTIDGEPVRGYLRPAHGPTGPTGATGGQGQTGIHGVTGSTGATGIAQSSLLMPAGFAPALERAQADLVRIRNCTGAADG